MLLLHAWRAYADAPPREGPERTLAHNDNSCREATLLLYLCMLVIISLIVWSACTSNCMSGAPVSRGLERLA